jgi:predicted amidohydrolase
MRIAAFQRFAVFDDPATIGESVRRDLVWADRQGVDLAIFPESYLQGHSYDRAVIERLALPLDGAVFGKLLDSLSDISATAVLGFFERREGRVLNSAVVIQGGRLLGVYAKTFPLEDGCEPGTHYPVWDKGPWRFGINICNDSNYEEAAEPLTRQGSNLICVLINNMLRPEKADIWRMRAPDNLRARARQTGCWIATADVTGPGRDGRLSYGCTLIIRPDGSIASRAAELAEDVAIFDLA